VHSNTNYSPKNKSIDYKPTHERSISQSHTVTYAPSPKWDTNHLRPLS